MPLWVHTAKPRYFSGLFWWVPTTLLSSPSLGDRGAKALVRALRLMGASVACLIGRAKALNRVLALDGCSTVQRSQHPYNRLFP